jgi:hypothetical protein
MTLEDGTESQYSIIDYSYVVLQKSEDLISGMNGIDYEFI